MILIGFSVVLATLPLWNVQQAAPASTSHPARAPSGFLDKLLTIENETYAYSVYVPADYTPDKPWPVVLFLHGSGERGRDGLLQTEVGIGTAIRRKRGMFPAIVVMPQCRPGMRWNDAMAEMALRCLEATSHEYHLDPARVYLTGLSLGGEGAWLIASRLPGRFAAVAPVCGFVGAPNAAPPRETVLELAGKLNRTPLWIFHGGADKAVLPDHSRQLSTAIRNAGGDVRYTEYPAVEHNCWDRAYASAEFWGWMFSHRLAPATNEAASQPASAPARRP